MKRIFLVAVVALLAVAASAQQPTARQLSALGLKGATLTEQREGIWKVTLGGKKAGHVVASAPFAKDVKGFNGPTPVLVYIDAKKTVRKVAALPSKDTPEFFQTAEPLLRKWEGKPAKGGTDLRVDAVSGATYSSRGLIGNVRAALAAYNKYAK